MALTDDAVFIPGTGYCFIAPSGTAKPASLTAPASPWENLGHTSRDDGLTITRDGGKSEVLGSWQNTSLRQRSDPTSFSISLHLLQLDNQALELYFGTGDVSQANEFGVVSADVSVQKALYVRIVDGANEADLYVPKVSITSDDDIQVDVQSFLALPIKCTVLQQSGSNLMTFINANLGA